MLGHGLLTEQNHTLIATSGQFDVDFYKAQLKAKDETLGRFDPVGHYLVKGALRGFDPSESFSTSAYKAEQGLGVDANPLLHFIRYTLKRLKNDGDFDPVYYAYQNPDVAHAYVDMAWHFLSIGAREGRRPSEAMSAAALCQKLNWRLPSPDEPVSVEQEIVVGPIVETVRREIDADYYLSAYPDVAHAGIDPAEHYVRHGADEGRNPCTWFNTKAYLDAYPDVRHAGVNPFFHYITAGRAEGRKLG
ncbi:glycosyltransferase [Asticcacaulis excentricus]|uniref:Glycosyltransferase n=1 Tax=Asticcacaulis excentricus TaxID=78587 RepID=A0A3G9G208_9CAUL|nr:glycosyltransferase [Asticcacaulis excentricus]